MATTKKHIINRTYLVSVLIFILAVSIVVKLVNIQFVKGDYYISLSEENNIKNVVLLYNQQIEIYNYMIKHWYPNLNKDISNIR